MFQRQQTVHKWRIYAVRTPFLHFRSTALTVVDRDHAKCPNRPDQNGDDQIACCYPNSAQIKADLGGEYTVAATAGGGYPVEGVGSAENNQVAGTGIGRDSRGNGIWEKNKVKS